MRFTNCTIGYVKELFLEKYQAVQDNDQRKIDALKIEYPELFNAQFMMDFLKNYFEQSRKNLGNNEPFKMELFKYQ